MKKVLKSIRNNMPVLMPDNHLLDLKNDIPKA